MTLVVGLMFACLILFTLLIRVGTSKADLPSAIQPQPVQILKAAEFKPLKLEVVEKSSYTDEELFYLAAAIYNEAGEDACSDDTRRLVGYVILNRVNDSRFPNTIKSVLEQKNQYGRFHWTGIKFADRASLPQEKNAVDRAYIIAKEVLEAKTIPIPSTVVFQAEFEQGISIYSYQDGMYFCHAKEVK